MTLFARCWYCSTFLTYDLMRPFPCVLVNHKTFPICARCAQFDRR